MIYARGAEMYKSCVWCGRVHPVGYDCPHRPARIRRNDETRQVKFRASTAWRKTAKRILRRDSYLCQACLNELPGTVRKYNSMNLSVHHITPLEEDFTRRLDAGNLITLCSAHHSQADHDMIDRATLYRLVRRDEDSSW